MAEKTRTMSVKFPCGECKTECKDGSIQCFKCDEWYHAGECSGIATNILRALPKSAGLLWLCKTCNEPGRRAIREGVQDQDHDSIRRKLETIEKQLKENQTSTQEVQRKMQESFEAQLKKIETSVETKISELMTKQEEMPTVIKNAWTKAPPNQPAHSMKKIMKETLAQQDREKEDLEKRESNLVLFNVPESKKQNAKEREGADLEKFYDFCVEGLKIPADSLPAVEKAIRLGKASTEDNVRQRPMKLILTSRDEKAQIFRSLRNLKQCQIEEYTRISVSHDYSKEARENIRALIEEAKRKDGDEAENLRYIVTGSAAQLKIQRRRKREHPQAEEL